jgi:two-component sensor histidine kinase/ABC-type amino acid transport substrate-binding protein
MQIKNLEKNVPNLKPGFIGRRTAMQIGLFHEQSFQDSKISSKNNKFEINHFLIQLKNNRIVPYLICRRILFSVLFVYLTSSLHIYADVRSVRVGIFPAAPLVMEKDGKPEGLFIDLIDYFSKKLDWKVEYVKGSWKEHLADLVTGKIDLLPAVGYTLERQALYDFNNNPVYIDSGVLFAGKRFNVNTVFDLNGKRVAAVSGSIYTKAFEDYTASFGVTCIIVKTVDNPSVMKAIVNGDADAGVCIYSLGNELARNYPVSLTAISFSPIALKFAVPKGKNQDLIAGINKILAPMVNDKNSLYSQSFRKWTMPSRSAELPAWIMWGIVGLLSLGLFLGFWTLLLRRQVVLKTRHLEAEISVRKQAEERIRKSLEEKEMLIRELYHRTKNTMQVIMGMIDLQAEDYSDNEELQQLVKITCERIQAVALVHQMLYRSHDLSRIPIKEYVMELTSLIMQGFGVSDERILLNIDVEDQFFVIDAVIPFGLILNELMTNSLKHAFPDGNGIISIGLSKQGTEINVLNYSDNGIGVPPGFDFRNQNKLGLKLIYNIGELQMQGSVYFADNNGVNCTIEIPMSFYKARI